MLGQRTGPRRQEARGWVLGGCGDMKPTMSEPHQQHLFPPDNRLLHAEDVARLREQMITRLVAQSTSPTPLPRWRAIDERVRLAMKGWRPGVRHDPYESSAE